MGERGTKKFLEIFGDFHSYECKYLKNPLHLIYIYYIKMGERGFEPLQALSH
jgi:hypothetical protein